MVCVGLQSKRRRRISGGRRVTDQRTTLLRVAEVEVDLTG